MRVLLDKIAVKVEAKIVEQTHILDEVRTLLKRSKLPYQDINLENALFVTYCDKGGNIIGSGGLEFYSPYALLRSVAVDESERGKAFGKEIVNDLVERAKNRSVKEIYLLTETAHGFFLKRGFADVAREDVPVELKRSTEFTSVCPVSAACMVYRF